MTTGTGGERRITTHSSFGPTLGWYQLPVVGETRRGSRRPAMFKAMVVAGVLAGPALWALAQLA